jgi:HK97 family phage major capsid protein
MNKRQLQQAKAAKLDAAKAILTAANGRTLTDDERSQYDNLLAEAKALNGDIERVEALEAEERQPEAHTAARAEAPNATKQPWKSLGEQLSAVAEHARTHGRTADPRLFAGPQGSNESVDAEGGFLVVPEFAAGILQRTYDVGLVASRCFQMDMSSNRLIMNAVDEDSRVDGQRWGGILAYWEAEASTYQGTKPKFKRLELVANKLIGLCYATEELLEDTSALESYINQAFPDEFAFKIDDAIINGLGAGMPLGIVNSGAAYQQAKDGGQASKTITVTNVLNMWMHMYARSRATSVWFINQDVEPQLYTLAFQNPTGSVLFTGPMYTPPGVNGNNTGYGLLMGRPVIPIEQCATLGTTGDILLCDMQQYLLAKKGGLRADTSIHVSFLTGEQAFRFMLRTDGQPIWKKPLTPKNGTNQLSPFITLQSR